MQNISEQPYTTDYQFITAILSLCYVNDRVECHPISGILHIDKN